jgi:hypothetical protein
MGAEAGVPSLQQTSNATPKQVSRFIGRKQPLQHAKINFNPNVRVGYLDCALDWCTYESHFSKQGKRESGTLPASLLFNQLKRKRFVRFKEIADGSIDRFDRFRSRLIVWKYNPHALNYTH